MSFDDIANQIKSPLDPKVLQAMLIVVAAFVNFATPDATAVSWTVAVENRDWYKITVEEADPIEDEKTDIDLGSIAPFWRWN